MKVKKIFGVLILFVIGINAIEVNAQNYKEIDKTFQLEKNGKISIDTYKGSINVETWDNAEVKVYVKIEADDNWDCTEPEDQLKNVDIDFYSSSSFLKIKSDYSHRNSSWGCNTLALVHYKIKIPKTASLKINDQKSDISITGINGYVDVNCYKGEIELKNISGEIDLDTYKGRASVQIDKLTRDSRFNTYKGEIDIYMPKDSKFSLDVDIEKRGDFDCDFDIDTKRENRYGKSMNFKGDINGGGKSIEVSTYKGSIRLLER